MRTDDRGFTLIELIIVVVVIAVLGAIAVPIYSGLTDSAKQSAVDRAAQTITNEVMAAHAMDPFTSAGRWDEWGMNMWLEEGDILRFPHLTISQSGDEITSFQTEGMCSIAVWRDDPSIYGTDGPRCAQIFEAYGSQGADFPRVLVEQADELRGD